MSEEFDSREKDNEDILNDGAGDPTVDGAAENTAESREEGGTWERTWQGAPASAEYGPDVRFDTKRKNSATAFPMILITVMVSLLCVFGGVTIGKMMGADGSSSSGDPTGTPSTPNNGVIMQYTDTSAADSDGEVLARIEKAAKSVVEIITTPYSSVVNTQGGAGSGVMVAEDDGYTYIVTNNHVIEGNYSEITVRTVEGKEYSAEIVGSDWLSDVAVVRIQAKGLTHAVWASSTNIKLGQSIIAIGNPLGSLGGSVSRGVVSCVERTITVEGVPMKLLQIDAAINPGNSGGGLFDTNGCLVGIVNAKSVATSIEGIGFAIPSDYAQKIAKELITSGYVAGRIDLGLNFAGITTPYGLTINACSADGVDIVAGDILYSLTVDGQRVQITSIDNYRSVLVKLKAGTQVKAVILRSAGWSYQQHEVVLTAQEITK